MNNLLGQPLPNLIDQICPEQVDRQEGDHLDFFIRHLEEAALLVVVGPPGLEKVAPYLFRRVTDERAVMCVLDQFGEYGRQAPGTDGLRFADLISDEEKRHFSRSICEELRSGDYRPGPERVVMISTGAEGGTRLFYVQNLQDRVAQRAAAAILQLLVDPRFDEHLFGNRIDEGRTQWHALALAEEYYLHHNRKIWVAKSIKDAYANVPLPRMLQVIQEYFLAEDLTDLLGRMLEGASTPGLRREGFLSPLLLDLYLHHYLDKPWRQRHPDLPLIRLEHNLLVLCTSIDEARQAHDSLVALLEPAGMPLMGDRVSAVRTLSPEQPATWLGLAIDSPNGGDFRYHIAESAWERLREALQGALVESDPDSLAYSSILNWLMEMAPAAQWKNNGTEAALKRLKALAKELGFEFLLYRVHLKRQWRNAHDAWLRLRRR